MPLEVILTIVQIIDVFTFYGIDVILLSSLTTLTIQLLKKIVRSSANKKMLSFLPFILGTVYYAAYVAFKSGDPATLLSECTAIAEHGFSVGALSTVLYVLYEQFVRGIKVKPLTAAVCESIAEGYVKGNVSEIAAAIAEAIKCDVTGGALKRVQAILTENAADGIDEREILLLAKTIIETLSHIN